MQLNTILNRLQKQPRFVYGKAELHGRPGGRLALRVWLHARKRCDPICSGCGQKRRAYDRLSTRFFEFVPLWAIAVYFVYAPRRADCPRCGVTVELMPWANGKSSITTTYAWFLASWAKVLSWTETARRFQASWQTVFRAVAAAVRWGREHMSLEGITSVGVDEFAWKKRHKYLTLVYQIDHGQKRLLWIGRDRTKATFEGFFAWLGEARSQAIRFIASDMWKAFLSVVARRASTAVHVLDRFHVAKLFSDAIDRVRREEMHELRRRGEAATLTKTRWILLKRQERLTPSQRGRLATLLRANLRTVRAYLLGEDFLRFWSYLSPFWAGRFLDSWTTAALRSRIQPFEKLARTLRDHRALLLNWFRARNAFSQGATEGLNNKARVTTKRAYGFRSYEHAEIALFHTLGNLPEPSWFTHRFW
jgi:transposase